ncbi:hypothetical protein J6590_038800 [Homalodisca vitripennis]|nr:hypothetical protein J6590_038800 [Homalodisca vitripennis]
MGTDSGSTLINPRHLNLALLEFYELKGFSRWLADSSTPRPGHCPHCDYYWSEISVIKIVEVGGDGDESPVSLLFRFQDGGLIRRGNERGKSHVHNGILFVAYLTVGDARYSKARRGGELDVLVAIIAGSSGSRPSRLDFHEIGTIKVVLEFLFTLWLYFLFDGLSE